MSTLSVDTINGQTTASKVMIPGHVTNVVQALKTDKDTVTSTSFVDVSGLSVSITPTSSSSKILVTVNVHGGHDAANYMLFNIVRDSTAIGQPTVAHNYPATFNSYTGDNVSGGMAIQNSGMTLLDSPSTTNATTYKVQVRTTAGTGTVNGRPNSTNGITVSSITVMEIGQ